MKTKTIRKELVRAMSLAQLTEHIIFMMGMTRAEAAQQAARLKRAAATAANVSVLEMSKGIARSHGITMGEASVIAAEFARKARNAADASRLAPKPARAAIHDPVSRLELSKQLATKRGISVGDAMLLIDDMQRASPTRELALKLRQETPGLSEEDAHRRAVVLMSSRAGAR